VFWIWDENNVANILIFLVVARQSRTSQLLTLPWSASCMGSWEGTQLGQLTPTGQRCITYRMTSCPVYELGELTWGAAMAAWGWTEYCSLGGEQLHCASLVLYILLLLLLLSLPLLSY